LYLRSFLLIGVAGTLLPGPVGCLVESTCYNDADCPSGRVCRAGKCRDLCESDEECASGQYCERSTGKCEEAECYQDSDCQLGFLCREHHCVEAGELLCPEDMVSISNLFCMDIYEASRPDADDISPGEDQSRATSRAGVKPWYPVDLATASQACLDAQKRLCTVQEWVPACRGEQNTDYTYGNDFDPVICNSIDTYCFCEPGSVCEDQDPCPFPHCWDICQAHVHVMPTGSFPDCVNSWGVYDINGNVWELTTADDGLLHFHGGAYNCLDSETLHRCDYDASAGVSAKGFRCCSDGERLENGDGGS
jgi:Cys-rich repeat protein